ncbi:MAG: RHS repeat-associated core domain-containing protein [Verrucomicrobiae bacterium]|nr:RHS repeat-associated core domain-containing protein [Verrucomicrobiae bacterium]
MSCLLRGSTPRASAFTNAAGRLYADTYADENRLNRTSYRSQTAAASYRYDPYGNTITSSGVLSSVNKYRFSSKELMAGGVNGIYSYGYRFYDPVVQRWLNRDSFGERGFEVLRRGRPNVRGSDGPNLYTFVRNKPVSAVDAFGLSLWVCTSRALGIIGVNHAYMWDDRENPPGHRDCSMQRSSGNGGKGDEATHDKNAIGPPPGLGDGFDVWYGPEDSGVTCTRVPNSNGKEQQALDCCRQKANSKPYWIPGLWDCHNPLDDCLKGIPLEIPPHPRFGKNNGTQ